MRSLVLLLPQEFIAGFLMANNWLVIKAKRLTIGDLTKAPFDVNNQSHIQKAPAKGIIVLLNP